MSLTASHGQSMLAPHMNSRATICRAAISENFFVTAAFHPISLIARSIFLAQLSVSKRSTAASPRKPTLLCSYRDSDLHRYSQLAMDEALIRSDSATVRCLRKPVSRMCESSFSAGSHDLLGLQLGRSGTEAEKEDL